MKSTSGSKNDSILLVAAEASSCMYAKLFIEKWRQQYPKTQFYGVGDQSMKDAGMNCIGLAEDMAVVGLQEVLKHYPEIKKCALDILKETERNPPRFAILLDYPGFNLRLAKRLKELQVSVVYYISPQLWAWKKGRVHQVKKYVDDMMVVFPFEVEFYQQYGITAHFIGHPLVEVVEAELENLQPSVDQEKRVLGLMPGSRKSEIANNFATQLQAAKILQKQHDLKIRVLQAPTLKRPDLQKYVDEAKIEVQLEQRAPTQMIKDCDYILTASGTATLQVALCGKPMVVMYRMNQLTALMARLLVRSVKVFCIVNLIAKKKIVPELFQELANPKRLAAEIDKLISNQKERDLMIDRLAEVKEKLGKGGATDNLVQYLQNKYGAL